MMGSQIQTVGSQQPVQMMGSQAQQIIRSGSPMKNQYGQSIVRQ